jgi:hypothetical protein
MSETRVTTEKYTFIVRDDGKATIDIERHGLPWITNFEGPGSKAILSLILTAAELAAEHVKAVG